jgi:hypothetical protein
MGLSFPRRRFLHSASALGLGTGLGTWELLRGITPAAEDVKVGPEMVRLRPEIEPVVRWIEETPRDKVFEKAVAELKGGSRTGRCWAACSWPASATSSRGP